MKRLALLDEDRMMLHPISIRFWALFILSLVCGVVLSVSAGAWYVVRSDYQYLNATIHEAVERNDRLMAICVLADETAKKQAAKRKTALGIGGESR